MYLNWKKLRLVDTNLIIKNEPSESLYCNDCENESCVFLHYLELGTTKPSSTQQILVFSSPTSTTQAALKPQPKTDDTDSCHIKMGCINKFIFHFRGK